MFDLTLDHQKTALDERALWFMRKYVEACDRLSKAATIEEITRLREESRSYAVEFTATVLILNPALAGTAQEAGK